MDAARINVRAVRDALPANAGRLRRLIAENARLEARVRELEEQLRRPAGTKATTSSQR